MLGRTILVTSLVALTAVVGAIEGAVAQESSGTTVRSRPRPDTDAIGLLAGGFVLYPSLTLGAEYNDNIFARDTNEDDDAIFTVSPQVVARSDWGRHALEFQGAATVFRNLDSQSEDVEDYSLAANGRIDILRDTFIGAGLGLERSHEDRGSPDDANGEEPTQATSLGAQLDFSHRFNRLTAGIGGIARRLDYDDVDAAGAAGGSINNDDRDRMEYETFLQLDYEFHPDASAFVRGGFNLERYRRTPDDAGFDRDSQGYEAVAGINLDLTGLVFGSFFGGLLYEEFEDSRFDSALGYSLGADIAWNVTPLTTVSLAASRGFEETTVVGASSTLTTDAAISVDHELLRSLLLNAGFSYKLEEFEGLSRDDDTIEAQLGATYFMSRYLHLNLDYSYRERFSGAAGQDFAENVVMFRARIQY